MLFMSWKAGSFPEKFSGQPDGNLYPIFDRVEKNH